MFSEEQIIDEYQKLDGLTKGDAIISYLRIMENLPMYGVHYYDVKVCLIHISGDLQCLL